MEGHIESIAKAGDRLGALTVYAACLVELRGCHFYRLTHGKGLPAGVLADLEKREKNLDNLFSSAADNLSPHDWRMLDCARNTVDALAK